MLTEVLVASFFLQMFALRLAAVLPGRDRQGAGASQPSSTLDVLVIGLVAISMFETILGILRTYLFAHTTNRIDVELGARLFRHLMALPIAYFQARRVGDSVARVRELENIRNFLTGSALTLVIDLFFTFVFLAVMFLYSPLLTCDRARRRFRSISGFRRGRRRCSAGGSTRSSSAARKTRRSWSRASTASRRSRRWRSSRRCSGAGKSSSPAMSRRASAWSASATWRARAVQLVNKLVTGGDSSISAPSSSIAGDLTVGELVAFNMLAGRVSPPVLRLAQMWQDFHQARLSVARLGDILNTTPEPTYNPGRAALPAIRGDVSFEHVDLPLPDRRAGGPAATSASTCPAGQIVGIVGPPARARARSPS